MPKTLVLIRHGYPLNEDEAGVDDEKQRPLSPTGIVKLQGLCQQLEKKLGAPSKILSSPILRAKQTADILAKHFSIDFDISQALGYEFEPETLLKLVDKLKDNQSLFLIGHNPNLSYFGQVLIKGHHHFQGLQPGSALALSFTLPPVAGNGELIKVFTPH